MQRLSATIGVIIIAAFGGFVDAAEKPAQELDKQALTLSTNGTQHKVAVSLPADWSVAPTTFKNSVRLINVATARQKMDVPTARIKIGIEPRLDHADALEQMRQFASVVPESDRTFLAIGGWPALRTTRLEQRPQPSQGPQFEDPLVLRINTWVAVGDRLVIINASLPSEATAELIATTKLISASLAFEAEGDPIDVKQELESLRGIDEPGGREGKGDKESSADKSAPAMELIAAPVGAPRGPRPGANDRVIFDGFGEVEVAVSPDGLQVVIGRQGDWVTSNDGGATFPFTGSVAAFDGGDPSVALGISGSFYYAGIDRQCQNTPYQAAVPNLGPNGTDCTGMSRSDNQGQTFGTAAVNPAVQCPTRAPAGMAPNPNECFPDQEHIAADRFNAGAGGDQVYSTWRNFDVNDQDAGLVCSQDSGVTWTAPLDLMGNSFFPRITVGQDGFVYVAAYGGGFFRLWKFSSCANGLGLEPGFPRNVAMRNPYDCPFPGHDRCDQNPTSQTVAVDDTDPNHIYYAYAADAGAGSDSNIFVRDSADGGMTWPAGRIVQVNSAVPARRIMPWMCTTNGDALVTWYDQRFAMPSQDSTDFYFGRAGLAGGLLVPKGEVLISEISDPWCDPGWPCATRLAPGETPLNNAAESCPVQPQLAGRCTDGMGGTPDSNIPCDFSDELATPGTYCPGPAASPSGNQELCNPGNGCPKYGDYNGNACMNGRLYAAWASATSPPGVPPPTNGIGVLFDVLLATETEVPIITVPGSVNFGDVCVGTTAFESLRVCNTGNANLEVDVIMSSDPQIAVTVPSSGYPIVISPDFCFEFEVTFTPTAAGPVTAILTIPSNDPARPEVLVDANGNGEESTLVTTFDGDFGDVCLSDMATNKLFIHNAGGCDLTITNIDSSNGEFMPAMTMNFPLVIGAGDEVTVPIEFKPVNDAVTESGNIRIFHTATNTASPKLLPVTGNSPPAVIQTFIADNGEFGEVCAGDFRDLDLTIQNDGACNAEIQSVAAVLGANAQPGDFMEPAGQLNGVLLEPANSLRVPIRFAPSAFDMEPPAIRNATVRVTWHTQHTLPFDTAVDATPIAGRVPPPDINVAIANSGDFGKVCKGDFRDLDLTLFNQGKCDLKIEDIALLPDPDSLELPDDLQLPLILSPDADFRFPVRYAPEECTDVPEERLIRITSDDPDEMLLDIDLTAVSPCPNIVIDPPLTGPLAFPPTVVDTTQQLGCYSDQTTNLRNNGECPLLITNITTAGNDFTVLQPTVFPIRLPSGEETLSLTVRFTPQADANPLAPSEVTSQLIVESDDPDGPENATLCGESVAQSGVRILVTDQSATPPVPIPNVDVITIDSSGVHTPSPISLRFTDHPVSMATVCDNPIYYHVDQESLPATHTTGSNPQSSYQAAAKEGNLQTSQSFTLHQCEFREFQLQVDDRSADTCLLLPSGAACSNDGQCCSGQCKGNGTCK